MRVITVAGKVDTRVLVYPLARALSLTGLTAIVTDDGAYRRLFKGKQLKGNVSGVDVSVGLNMDENLKNSLNNSGIAYDNLIVVSSNYIPKDTDSLILCHGYDNSMSQEIEEEKKEDEEEAPKKKKGKKGVVEEPVEEIAVPEEPKSDVIKEIDEDDTFEYDPTIPMVDLYISYNKPVDKYQKGILLKEGYMQYIYSCEERKVLERFTDKAVNKTITTLLHQNFIDDNNLTDRVYFHIKSETKNNMSASIFIKNIF